VGGVADDEHSGQIQQMSGDGGSSLVCWGTAIGAINRCPGG
jgi:hypothetical protein